MARSARLLGLMVVPIVALVTGSLAAAAPARSLETITVPATLEMQHGANTADPGNCSSVAFLKWKHVDGTQSARATFNVRTSGAPRPMSVSKAAPFDDVLDYVRRYEVPADHHWLLLGKNAQDGPKPDNCAAAAARLRSALLPPFTVELTVEDAEPPVVRSLPGQSVMFGRSVAALGEVECPAGAKTSCKVTCEPDSVRFSPPKPPSLRFAVRCSSPIRPGETGRIGIRATHAMTLAARGGTFVPQIRVVATRGEKTVTATVSRSVKLMLTSDRP